MHGMAQPNYDDLIECLTTLSQFNDAGRPPTKCLDLYYHAIDLAEELDATHQFESETGLGLAFFVEKCAFVTALNVARERAPAPQV